MPTNLGGPECLYDAGHFFSKSSCSWWAHRVDASTAMSKSVQLFTTLPIFTKAVTRNACSITRVAKQAQLCTVFRPILGKFHLTAHLPPDPDSWSTTASVIGVRLWDSRMSIRNRKNSCTAGAESWIPLELRHQAGRQSSEIQISSDCNHQMLEVAVVCKCVFIGLRSLACLRFSSIGAVEPWQHGKASRREVPPWKVKFP